MNPSTPTYREFDRLQTGAARSSDFDIDPWRQTSTDMNTGAAPPTYSLVPGVDGPLSQTSWEKNRPHNDSSASSSFNPYASENSRSSSSNSHAHSNSQLYNNARFSTSPNADVGSGPNLSFYTSAVAGSSGPSSYNQPEKPEAHAYHNNNELKKGKKHSYGDIENMDLPSPSFYAPPSHPPPGFKAKSTPNLFTQAELKKGLPPTPPPDLSLAVPGPESDPDPFVGPSTSPSAQPLPSSDWTDATSTVMPHPLSLDEFTRTMLPSSPAVSEPANQDQEPSFPQPWGNPASTALPARSSMFLPGQEFTSGSGTAGVQGRYSFYPDQSFPMPTSDYKLVVFTKNLDLYLDRGNQSTKPDYGKGESVVGYVDLKKLKNVIDMSVTLEGRIQVMFTKGGKMYDQIVLPLFTMTRVLYSANSSRPPSQSQKYLFELKFPETCDSRFSPLPPSWWVSETVFDRPVNQPAFFAKVEYRIRADMTAKNLMSKKQYRVETPAGYYPRNCSSIPLPGPNELVNLEDGFLVREIKAALPPMGRTGFEELLSPTPFTAKVQVQKPLVYISGSSIAYSVHLSSPVHTVPAALKLQVQLIKTMEVWIYGKGYLKEHVVGTGDNANVRFVQDNNNNNAATGSKGPGGATVIIEGSCNVGEEGKEMTWKINRLAYVKYSIRFTVTPTAQAAEFATFKDSLPAFCHSEDIEVVTDPADAIQSERDASRPSNRVKRSRYKSRPKPKSNNSGTNMDVPAEIEPFIQPELVPAPAPAPASNTEEKPSK